MAAKTIAKMLKTLKGTKSEIFSAMKDKGIPVKESHTFREYADLIKQIDISEDDYDPNEGEGDDTDPSGSGGTGDGGAGGGGASGSGGTKYVFTKLNITSRDQNNFRYSPGKTQPVPITSATMSMNSTKNTNTANDSLMEQKEEKEAEQTKLQGFLSTVQQYLSSGKKPSNWASTVKGYYGKDVDVDSITPSAFSAALTGDISNLDTDISGLDASMLANADEDQTKYGGAEVDFTATNTIYLFNEVTCNMPDDENATFSVTFHDADGSTIYTEEDVPFGGFAVFDSSEHDLPTVQDDIEKIFAGWNPTPVNVKQSMHCYPVFTSGSTRQEGEITDTWAEIMNGDKTYEVGQWKWLILPNTVEYAVTKLTENGNTDTLTGRGPYNVNDFSNSTTDGIIGRAIRMQIVDTGEDGSKYTWLSMEPIGGSAVASGQTANSVVQKYGDQWDGENSDCIQAPFTLNCKVLAGATSRYGFNHRYDIGSGNQTIVAGNITDIENNNDILTSSENWRIMNWLDTKLKPALPPELMNKITKVRKYSARLNSEETYEQGWPALGWDVGYHTESSIWIPSAYEMYGDAYVEQNSNFPKENQGVTYSDVVTPDNFGCVLRNTYLNRSGYMVNNKVESVYYTNYMLTEGSGYPRQIDVDPDNTPITFRIGFCTI